MNQYRPLNTPEPMTIITVHKLIPVKMLFSMLDSFTPDANRIESKMMMKNAKKSGYGAKNETFIGSNFLKYSDM